MERIWNKQVSERLIIWLCSFCSAAVGCVLTYLTSIELVYGYAFVGFAHLIVLYPMLYYSHTQSTAMITACLLCILFPVWGFILGVPCIGVASPFICSLAWGIVLLISLRRQAAFVIVFVVGVMTNLFLLKPVLDDGTFLLNDHERVLSGSYYTWFVLMGFAMPWIMSLQPSARFSGTDICEHCNYSLAGLEEDAICPECGQSRTVL
jgi:hypothetical protein